MMKAYHIEQNGFVENGQCQMDAGDRISIELTGSLVNQVPDDEVQQFADQIKLGLEALRLLVRLEPYMDCIVCYASDLSSYPNRLAYDVHKVVQSYHEHSAPKVPVDAADVPDSQIDFQSGPPVSMGRAIGREIGGV